MHKYPFAGRLLLFLVPLMLLAVARGAWAVAVELRPNRPFAAWLFLGLLVIAPAVETYQSFRRPQREEQIAPVLAAVRDEMQPGDRVYVYWGAVPAFTYYTRDNPFPPGVVLGVEHHEDHLGYRDDLRRFAGEPRVWLIFSHPHQDEELVVQSYAEALGECRRKIQPLGRGRVPVRLPAPQMSGCAGCTRRTAGNACRTGSTSLEPLPPPVMVN